MLRLSFTSVCKIYTTSYKNNKNCERIFSELVNLCLNVIFTHSPELLVKLGRNLVGAQILHSLKEQKQKVLCI